MKAEVEIDPQQQHMEIAGQEVEVTPQKVISEVISEEAQVINFCLFKCLLASFRALCIRLILPP